MSDASPPLTGDAFAERMARLGGFETRPRLAVGVSGGADSLALTLLLKEWVTARGGSLLALTVDHGLRATSADEAAQVGAWLAERGIEHGVLRWDGAKPTSGIQAAARAARHRLLAERCRADGILHLALAHHRDDQAETVLLRLARGSGVDGLAGMAPVRTEGAVRILRPLLDVSHARLVATCQSYGQAWIEDPSNHNPAFARARLRAARSTLAAEGLDAERLADTARRAARTRSALDIYTASILAEAAELHPEGWIRLDPRPLQAAPDEVGLRAFVRCLLVVGGAAYPPKAEAAERAFADLLAGSGAGRTMAGCQVIRRGDRWLIVREPVGVTERKRLIPSVPLWWDRRFTLRLESGPVDGVDVARLGEEGWRVLRERRPELVTPRLPAPARAALPALWSGGRLEAVPSLGFSDGGGGLVATVAFTPAVPLGGPAFPVVSTAPGII